MPDLNEFIEWVNQGQRRSVKIDLNPNYVQILVGDYDECHKYHCQIVNSVSEINLKKSVEENELKELSRLKAKYEPEAIPQCENTSN